MTGRVARVLGAGLDLLLPTACGACGAPTAGALGADGVRRLLCARCAARLSPPPPPRCGRCDAPLGTRPPAPSDTTCRECREWPEALAAVRCASLLEPPAERMVYALKYEGWPEMADEMARALAPRLRELVGGGPDPFLVPVPTTRRRQRLRGYNQAERVAVALARRSNLELVRALRRRERGGSQVALHRDARRANVRGAFQPVEPGAGRIRGEPVIVVDDVLTTGATAAEVAEELTRAGASSVRLLAFARALPTGSTGTDGGDSSSSDLLDALNSGRAPGAPESNTTHK